MAFPSIESFIYTHNPNKLHQTPSSLTIFDSLSDDKDKQSENRSETLSYPLFFPPYIRARIESNLFSLKKQKGEKLHLAFFVHFFISVESEVFRIYLRSISPSVCLHGFLFFSYPWDQFSYRIDSFVSLLSICQDPYPRDNATVPCSHWSIQLC